MQEFTINSDSNSKKPVKPRQEQIQKKAKTPPQVLETTSEPNQTLLKNLPKSSGLNPLTLVFIFLSGVFATLAFVFILLYLKEIRSHTESYDQTKQAGQVRGETTEVSDIPKSMQNKIYFTDGNNIFRAKKDGSKIIQLSEFDDESEIYELEIVNENKLGYIYCKNSCEIQLLDIQTRTHVAKSSFPPIYKPIQLTWLDETNYAYTLKNQTQSLLEIHIFMEDNNKVIDQMLIPSKERNFFIEDSKRLSFSPDGKKLLHIHTSSEYGLNFTTTVYSISGQEFAKISNSTMPVWLDNNSIVYRNYSNQGSGYLYLFDLDKNQGLKINSSDPLAYHPVVLNKQIAYWKSTNMGSSFVSDQTSSSKVGNQLINPIWLNKNELVLAKTRACESFECRQEGTFEYETQFVIDKYVLYNMKNQSMVGIEVNSRYMQNGIATWESKHAYSL